MNKSKKVRRSRDEWRRLVERCECGELSPAEFCRREDLNPNTFRVWRSRVRSETNAPVPFVEVVPTSAPSAVATPWLIELELPSGAKLRVRG